MFQKIYVYSQYPRSISKEIHQVDMWKWDTKSKEICYPVWVNRYEPYQIATRISLWKSNLVGKTTLSNCKPEYDVDIELLTVPSVRCFFTLDINQVTKDRGQVTKVHKKESLHFWFHTALVICGQQRKLGNSFYLFGLSKSRSGRCSDFR